MNVAVGVLGSPSLAVRTVSVEVALLGSPSLVVLMVSVDLKQR